MLERGPATALIDGDQGMGHVVMTYAAKLAIELARASGVGWVGARRSNHAGAGAIYAAIPLEHGMVGIYGAASSVHHMAPWGGTEPLLGTNPIAVAIPTGDEAPVIFDIATSLASNGAIRTHELEGRPMPQGWVQNRKDGSPITDPSRINEGTYLPMGGYKGCGPLARHRAAGRTAQPRRVRARRQRFRRAARGELNVGQFVIALDVARFRAAGRVQGRGRPPHPRPRLLATAAGRSTKSACRARAARRAARSGKRTACRSARRWSPRSTTLRNRSASRRSARAHDYGRDTHGRDASLAGIAVLALLAALLSPAAGG